MKYIYTITNKLNDKKYVGLTNNPKRRKSRHLTDLKYNRHDNEHLQRAYNKYGLENFDFEVIYSEKCSFNEIGETEKDYIEKYNSIDEGYNISKGGIGNNGFPSRFSKEDVFNIKAVVENIPRSGGVLEDIFNTSRSTINRISKNATNVDICNEYDALSLKEKQQIFNSFNDKHKIGDVVQKRLGKRARVLDECSYLYVLEYNHRHKRKSSTMARILGCCSSTLQLFIKGETNMTIHNKYNLLDSHEKDRLYVQAKNLFE